MSVKSLFSPFCFLKILKQFSVSKAHNTIMTLIRYSCRIKCAKDKVIRKIVRRSVYRTTRHMLQFDSLAPSN